MPALRIGCLAWGSLLWDPRTLPMSGAFRLDGPRLPIEFSRVAVDGRVTLVIDPTAEPVQAYWVRLAVTSLEEAIRGLGLREKIAAEKWSCWIGVQSASGRRIETDDIDESVRKTIVHWLGAGDDEKQSTRGLDAVVWTALPSRSPDGGPMRPDYETLLVHLRSLEGEAKRRAEEYIRRAPRSIRTAFRARFEADLGWVPTVSEEGC